MSPKCLWTAIAVLLAGMMLWGCEITDTVYIAEPDRTPPGVPRGVSSITGNHEVTVIWFGSSEADLAGYIVYRADPDDELYYEISELHITQFNDQWSYVDRNLANGVTYLYAVSAFDDEGNESNLSYEDVFDTPRPDGFDEYINATNDMSGFDFSSAAVVPWNSVFADVVFTFDEELQTLFIEAADENVDVQDFGFTSSLDDLDWAPEDGWSTVGWSEVINGHTYVVWTADNRYAKLRVFETGQTWVRFDWAYQTVAGLPELKRVPESKAADRLRAREQSGRKPHADGRKGL